MKPVSAKLRLTISLAIGFIVALVVGKTLNWSVAPLLGWDSAALVFLTWVWFNVLSMSGQETQTHALREDPSRVMADVLLLVASIASLVAVGLVLSKASNSEGVMKLAEIGLGIASVVLSWAVVHTVFTLRYAELYYKAPIGGVNFNEKTKPDYKDFAYLAFTIGMTFQVSDTDLENKKIRGTALRHAMISYLFGTVIVATTINLIAGLSK